MKELSIVPGYTTGSFHFNIILVEVQCFDQGADFVPFTWVSASLILDEHAITTPQRTQRGCTRAQCVIGQLGSNSKGIFFSSPCFATSTTNKAIRKSGEPINK